MLAWAALQRVELALELGAGSRQRTAAPHPAPGVTTFMDYHVIEARYVGGHVVWPNGADIAGEAGGQDGCAGVDCGLGADRRDGGDVGDCGAAVMAMRPSALGSRWQRTLSAHSSQDQPTNYGRRRGGAGTKHLSVGLALCRNGTYGRAWGSY